MKRFTQKIRESKGIFLNEAKNGESVKVKVGKEWVDATVSDGSPFRGKIEVKLSDGKKIDVNLDKEVKFLNEATTGEPDAELYFKMADNICNLLDLSKDISDADVKEIAQSQVDLGTLPADVLSDSAKYSKLKDAIEARKKAWTK